MLSEDEENKLDMYFEILELSKEQNTFPRLNAYDMEWLCKKLREANEETKKCTCVEWDTVEAQKAAQEIVRSKLYQPNNEISDRFTPRD